MGQRHFSEAIHLPAGHAPRAVTTGDLDGDGDLEIATANGLGQSVSLLLNAGGRRFERVADLVNDGGTPSVALGDVDLDGDLDLVRANGGLDTVSVFLNDMTRPASRDVDSDGVPDECGGEVFVRGDRDGTSGIDLTDAVYVLNHAFLGGRSCREPPERCRANG